MNSRTVDRRPKNFALSTIFMKVKGRSVTLGEVLDNPSVRRQAVTAGLDAANRWVRKHGLLPELAHVTNAVRQLLAESRDGKLALWRAGSVMVNGKIYSLPPHQHHAVEVLPSGNLNGQGACVSGRSLCRLLLQSSSGLRTGGRRTR